MNKSLIFFILLFSFGCSLEQEKTKFLEQSIQFQNEAIVHYNSPKPYHQSLVKLYSCYKKCEASSVFLRGSEPVMEQMKRVYIVLIDYRLASYDVDKELWRYREVFQREFELLSDEINNFSAQK